MMHPTKWIPEPISMVCKFIAQPRLGERAHTKKKKKNHGNELDVNQVLTLYIYIYIYFK